MGEARGENDNTRTREVGVQGDELERRIVGTHGAAAQHDRRRSLRAFESRTPDAREAEVGRSHPSKGKPARGQTVARLRGRPQSLEKLGARVHRPSAPKTTTGVDIEPLGRRMMEATPDV